MSFKEVLLYLYDKKMNCSITEVLQCLEKDILTDKSDFYNTPELTYMLLDNISKGIITSPHITKEEAIKIKLYIDTKL